MLGAHSWKLCKEIFINKNWCNVDFSHFVKISTKMYMSSRLLQFLLKTPQNIYDIDQKLSIYVSVYLSFCHTFPKLNYNFWLCHAPAQNMKKLSQLICDWILLWIWWSCQSLTEFYYEFLKFVQISSK